MIHFNVMNRKVLFSLTALVAAALTSFTAYKSFTPQLSEADILLNENIEALTDGESMNCENINGFKSWAIKGFLKPKRQFYDCCFQIQEGYSPEGLCRR